MSSSIYNKRRNHEIARATRELSVGDHAADEQHSIMEEGRAIGVDTVAAASSASASASDLSETFATQQRLLHDSGEFLASSALPTSLNSRTSSGDFTSKYILNDGSLASMSGLSQALDESTRTGNTVTQGPIPGSDIVKNNPFHLNYVLGCKNFHPADNSTFSNILRHVFNDKKQWKFQFLELNAKEYLPIVKKLALETDLGDNRGKPEGIKFWKKTNKKDSLSIKNWKTIEFEDITNTKSATKDDPIRQVFRTATEKFNETPHVFLGQSLLAPEEAVNLLLREILQYAERKQAYRAWLSSQRTNRKLEGKANLFAVEQAAKKWKKNKKDRLVVEIDAMNITDIAFNSAREKLGIPVAPDQTQLMPSPSVSSTASGPTRKRQKVLPSLDPQVILHFCQDFQNRCSESKCFFICKNVQEEYTDFWCHHFFPEHDASIDAIIFLSPCSAPAKYQLVRQDAVEWVTQQDWEGQNPPPTEKAPNVTSSGENPHDSRATSNTVPSDRGHYNNGSTPSAQQEPRVTLPSLNSLRNRLEEGRKWWTQIPDTQVLLPDNDVVRPVPEKIDQSFRLNAVAIHHAGCDKSCSYANDVAIQWVNTWRNVQHRYAMFLQAMDPDALRSSYFDGIMRLTNEELASVMENQVTDLSPRSLGNILLLVLEFFKRQDSSEKEWAIVFLDANEDRDVFARDRFPAPPTLSDRSIPWYDSATPGRIVFSTTEAKPIKVRVMKSRGEGDYSVSLVKSETCASSGRV